MPLKPHPTDPDKLIYESRKYLFKDWVDLTDEEIWTVLQFRGYNTDTIEIAKAIEQALKKKNT